MPSQQTSMIGKFTHTKMDFKFFCVVVDFTSATAGPPLNAIKFA